MKPRRGCFSSLAELSQCVAELGGESTLIVDLLKAIIDPFPDVWRRGCKGMLNRKLEPRDVTPIEPPL